MYHVLPTPKVLTPNREICKLDGLPIVLAPMQDVRLRDAAHVLKQELAAVTGTCPAVSTGSKKAGCIYIETKEGAGEGYTLSVQGQGICITGAGAAGTFYGIQTLRQLLKDAQNRTLAGVDIEDEPDFSIRGIYHDVTRGRVPTLETLKSLADTLSFYKINMLQLYIEDAFAFEELKGVMQPHEVLTPEEIRTLDDYCYARFVELTPSISTFGHLYRLLQSPKYRHLCEYEDFVSTRHPWIEKMMHHTIDVSNPQSIEVVKSMIDQFMGLCRSDYFNICCDETFDLCKGRNAGLDAGEAYFGFVNQIIRHVKSHGKQVMMWGDIVLQHPEKVKELPDDTVMLNWNYCAQPGEEGTIAFEQAGLPQIVCPGTSTWNRFIEDAACAKGNICGMARYGKNHGALGILTTNWGDFGNVGNLNGALYGLTLGAQMGWQAEETAQEEYELTFSLLAYGQRENMAEKIRRLSSLENAACWGSLIHFISTTQYEKTPLALPVKEEEQRQNLALCLDLQQELSDLPNNIPTEDLRLTARCVETMLRLFLYLGGFEEKPDVESFLTAYRENWLRDNKLSQLSWIEYTLRAL